MKNIKIEKITKDWELKQRFLLKEPEACRELARNAKRAARYGYSAEEKRLNKYGINLADYELDNYAA